MILISHLPVSIVEKAENVKIELFQKVTAQSQVELTGQFLNEQDKVEQCVLLR